MTFQPTIDYPDLSQAAQITDDSHSPHYKWDRYSAYVRDYTGLVPVFVFKEELLSSWASYDRNEKKSSVRYEKIIRYMALHVGDTAPPGTAWAFNKDIKWVYYTMDTYIRMVKR